MSSVPLPIRLREDGSAGAAATTAPTPRQRLAAARRSLEPPPRLHLLRAGDDHAIAVGQAALAEFPVAAVALSCSLRTETLLSVTTPRAAWPEGRE